MSHSLSERPVTFHISLNVSDIGRSVEFFSKVFGMSPTKHRTDYAKFELQNPPLTFSLDPGAPSERGALNHVGFKFQTSQELVELQRRLEMAGLRSEREEGVECCYSKQTKFWLHDPDGTLWEMYVLEGDLELVGVDLVGLRAEVAAQLGLEPRAQELVVAQRERELALQHFVLRAQLAHLALDRHRLPHDDSIGSKARDFALNPVSSARALVPVAPTELARVETAQDEHEVVGT